MQGPSASTAMISLMASALLVACGSGGDTTSGAPSDEAATRFRLSTDFQGPDRPLGLIDADSGTVALLDRRDDADGVWTITPLVGGAFRLANEAAGDAVSLDIVNDGVFEDVRLRPNEEVTGQFWRIEPLANGFCRFTTDFLGSELALDIVNDDVDSRPRMTGVADVSGQYWRIEPASAAPASTSVPSCTG